MTIAEEIAACQAAEALGYLDGASRDGCYNRSHRTWRISQRERSWLLSIQALLQTVGARSWIYREGSRSVWALETSFCLRTSPTHASREWARGFARGYFDAEGGIPRDPSSRFYIQFVQRDLEDLLKVRASLDRFEIITGRVHNPSVRVDADYWRFYVAAGSHRAFAQRISSWHPRKRPTLDGLLLSDLTLS